MKADLDEKMTIIYKAIMSPIFTEHESECLVELGNRVSPDPEWIGYIFWPDRYGLDGSIESAIKKIKEYRPIVL